MEEKEAIIQCLKSENTHPISAGSTAPNTQHPVQHSSPYLVYTLNKNQAKITMDNKKTNKWTQRETKRKFYQAHVCSHGKMTKKKHSNTQSTTPRQAKLCLSACTHPYLGLIDAAAFVLFVVVVVVVVTLPIL